MKWREGDTGLIENADKITAYIIFYERLFHILCQITHSSIKGIHKLYRSCEEPSRYCVKRRLIALRMGCENTSTSFVSRDVGVGVVQIYESASKFMGYRCFQEGLEIMETTLHFRDRFNRR